MKWLKSKFFPFKRLYHRQHSTVTWLICIFYSASAIPWHSFWVWEGGPKGLWVCNTLLHGCIFGSYWIPGVSVNWIIHRLLGAKQPGTEQPELYKMELAHQEALSEAWLRQCIPICTWGRKMKRCPRWWRGNGQLDARNALRSQGDRNHN